MADVYVLLQIGEDGVVDANETETNFKPFFFIWYPRRWQIGGPVEHSQLIRDAAALLSSHR